jgi:hypothetical protein
MKTEDNTPPASPVISNIETFPRFRFVEFNPRRKSRRVEAARVEVAYSSDLADKDELWMSARDIRNNLKTFGENPELRKALAAYGLSP